MDFNDTNTARHHAALARAKRLHFLHAHTKPLSLVMDLAAADGVNGNPPIDWDAMDKLGDHEFLMKLVSISARMDRETGKLVV